MVTIRPVSARPVGPGRPVRSPRPDRAPRPVRPGRPGPSRPVGRPEIRPHFARVLVAFTVLIFGYFTLQTLGRIPDLGIGSMFEPGLAVVALVGLTSSAWLSRPERMQLALTGILALVVTVPINRVDGLTRVGLLLFIGVILVLAVVALSAGRSRFSHRTVLLATVLFGLMVASSLLAASTSGLLKLAMSMIPGIAAFFVAGRLDHTGRRNVAIAVVALAAIEALIAIPEPFLFPRIFYAAVSTDGQVFPESNLIPGLLRAQGTMGHPLPLGFLLVIAVALLLRVVEPRGLVKWPLVALFIAGTVTAGSRNSLILALVLLLFYPGRRLTAARLFWSALVAVIGVLVAVSLDRISFAFIGEFAASGSFTHRVGALDSFDQLLSRQSLLHVVLGNGFGGIPGLFDAGLLQTDGLDVVDNQFIAQFGQAGLIALVALLVLTVRPLFARDWHWRGATLVVLANAMIYDWMSWPSSATLALFVLGAAFAQVDSSPVTADPAPPVAARPQSADPQSADPRSADPRSAGPRSAGRRPAGRRPAGRRPAPRAPVGSEPGGATAVVTVAPGSTVPTPDHPA